MKPIPALDENGEFVEATLRSGEKCPIFTLDDGDGIIQGPHPLSWNSSGRCYNTRESDSDITDLPAVRERVERARKARTIVVDNPSYTEWLVKDGRAIDEARALAGE